MPGLVALLGLRVEARVVVVSKCFNCTALQGDEPRRGGVEDAHGNNTGRIHGQHKRVGKRGKVILVHGKPLRPFGSPPLQGGGVYLRTGRAMGNPKTEDILTWASKLSYLPKSVILLCQVSISSVWELSIFWKVMAVSHGGISCAKREGAASFAMPRG